MKTLGVGIVLLALLAAAACEEELTAHTMKHVETAENTYTAVFRRGEEGHVHVIMQPCFGRELALCLHTPSLLPHTADTLSLSFGGWDAAQT